MIKRSILLLLIFTLYVNSYEIKIPAFYDTLSNGLKVLIVKNEDVPVVSCRLYYFMGSYYEGPGTSGLSHLYEHMMFKGTKRLGTTNYKAEVPIMASIDSIDKKISALRDNGVPETDSLFKQYRKQIFKLLDKQRKFIKKDEIWETYLNNGGTGLNAWTSDDITAYIVTLPKNKTELFYWIEADRMANPVLREFYSERDVVTEERRMRYDNKPLNNYWQMLMAKFYTSSPYRIPTIGWMSDIRAYTREKLKNHVNRYYTPDNAIIILVGNIDPEKEFAKLKKYFDVIPRAKTPKQMVVTKEPESIGETRFTVYDKAQPRIDLFFQIPGYPDSSLVALDLAEGILSGRSGRLYKRLVKKEKLCTSTGASCSYKFDKGYFQVWATLTNSADPKKVEEIINEELNKLKTNNANPLEMERVKNSVQMSFMKKLKSLEGLSDQLAMFELLGSWKNMLDYPNKINEVTPDNIRKTLNKYLIKNRSTVGRLLNDKEGDK